MSELVINRRIDVLKKVGITHLQMKGTQYGNFWGPQYSTSNPALEIPAQARKNLCKAASSLIYMRPRLTRPSLFKRLPWLVWHSHSCQPFKEEKKWQKQLLRL